MITLTVLNIAWHSLLLSALGWVLVRYALKDARRRAWAAAVVLGVTTVAPLGLTSSVHSEPPVAFASDTESMSSWKPDWKVKLEPVRPSIPMPASQPKQRTWDWSEMVVQSQRLWMAGLLVLALVHGVGTVRAWTWRAKLKPGPRDGVRMFTGPGSPCVTGVVKPVIAVSQAACESFTEEQWRWLLAHEGEHVRGHDTAVAWLFGWVRAWLWWNPFVHQLIGQWSQAREEVCDAVAVGDSDSGGRYADFLLRIASAHSSAAMAMAASRPAKRLRARLLAVLEKRRVSERLGSGFVSVVLALIAGGVMVSGCSGVEDGGIASPKSVHVYQTFVEPQDFLPRVAELRKQGYELVSPDDTHLANVEEAQLKRPDGEKVSVLIVRDKTLVVYALYVPPNLPDRLGGKGTVQESLQAKGIAFPRGSSAVFNKTTSQLLLKNTEANCRRAMEVVESDMESKPQVYIQSRIIEAPKLLGEDGKLYDEASAQALIRSVSQTKGINLISAPAVTTKQGQRAMVEVTKEEPGGADNFVGLRIDLLPRPAADGALRMACMVDLAQEPGEETMGSLKKNPKEIDWKKVRHWKKDFAEVIKHGETRLMHLGETQRGRFVTVLVSVAALDPSGKKVEGGFDKNLAPKLRGVRLDASAPAPRNNADTGKMIHLTANVVEGELPLAEGGSGTNSSGSSLEALAAPFTKNLVGEEAGTAVLPEPGIASLSGVLTDPQYQVVMRELGQMKGLQVTSLPNGTVKPGEDFLFKTGDESYDVSPVIGPDGYTIDLSLVHKAGEAVKGRNITTAVTIWDGQTLIMKKMLSQDREKKTSRYKLFMLTARLIKPAAVPAKQTK